MWDLLNQSINLSLLLTWFSLPALLLVPLALRRLAGGRRALEHAVLPELTAGVLLCLVFYVRSVRIRGTAGATATSSR